MARPVAPRGEARARVLEAALELFTTQGVSGTSLQMIADRIGVTKAAVYFQFHTKEEILEALIAPAFARVSDLVAAAQAEPDPVARREVALRGLVDLVVDHRRGAALMHMDPSAHAFLEHHRPFKEPINALATLLGVADANGRVRFACFAGGAMLCGVNPELRDVDDVTLRSALHDVGRRLLLQS